MSSESAEQRPVLRRRAARFQAGQLTDKRPAGLGGSHLCIGLRRRPETDEWGRGRRNGCGQRARRLTASTERQPGQKQAHSRSSAPVGCARERVAEPVSFLAAFT